MTEIRAGALVVATTLLVDPNFAETVVLMLDVDETGALGVVLNRPSGVPISEVLAGWAESVVEPEVLFQGGPVSTEGALAVAMLRQGGHPPVGFREVDGLLGVIDLETPTELLGASLAGLRIFAGYAGWSPGQLEREVDEGHWHVVPAQLGDAFVTTPDQLWREVMRRQPGDLAWHSTRPLDPDLN